MGQKRPNELGLSDMSGNVYEWCWDWYNDDYYASSLSVDPRGPSEGFKPVIRGGCWGRTFGRENYARVSFRSFYDLGRVWHGKNLVGFRIVRNSK